MSSYFRELAVLKTHGHAVIVDIQKKNNWTADMVYSLLAKRLKVPRTKAHFTNMNMDETKRAIKALYVIHDYKKMPKKRVSKPRNATSNQGLHKLTPPKVSFLDRVIDRLTSFRF